MGSSKRVYSFEERLRAVKEIARGGCGIAALSRKSGVPRRVLYGWWAMYRQEGAEGLKRQPGRPRGGVRRRGLEPGEELAALRRKVAEQSLVIDFLERACKRVGASRQPNTGSGGTASTARSKR